MKSLLSLSIVLLASPLFGAVFPHLSLTPVVKLSADKKVVRVGVEFKMEKGWHLYWQNPGDSGEPVKIKWQTAEWRMHPLDWPVPERISTPPLLNYGYEGVLVLSALTQESKALQDSKLAYDVSWLVCKEQCIPGKTKLEIHAGNVQAASRPDAYWAEWEKRFPTSYDAKDLSFSESEKNFTLSLKLPKSVVEVYFFPAESAWIKHAAQQKVALKDGGVFEVELLKSDLMEGSLNFLPGILKIKETDKETNYEVVFTKSSNFSVWMKFLEALFLAFLGGMILNLMPCVFPVLSIKVLNFVELGKTKRKLSLYHALAYTGGIEVSFMLLLAGLVILRQAGQAIGWGFQLQSPFFVLFLISLLYAMGLNLLGTFEIGTSWIGVGSKLSNRSGYAGSFFSGILATIVATPCTAPFMGTAMGYALSQPIWVAIAVFAFLGLGLAFPYLLLSYFPSLHTFLPRPGKWMENFKQAMSFPLFATCLWLVWVLGNQIGAPGIMATLIICLTMSLGLWFYGKTRGGLVWLLPFVLSTALSVYLTLPWFQGVVLDKPPAGKWEEFSQEKVEASLKNGVPVFIDFTASWCITCQVNEKIALNREEVQKAFENKKVLLMKADWTSEDPKITKALAAQGRVGVPLYLLYDPNKPKKPYVLPQILTPAIVLDFLNKF